MFRSVFAKNDKKKPKENAKSRAKEMNKTPKNGNHIRFPDSDSTIEEWNIPSKKELKNVKKSARARRARNRARKQNAEK